MSETGDSRAFAGAVQEGVGQLAGDTKTQAEGLYRSTSAAAKGSGDLLADLAAGIRKQPLLSTLLAVAAGFLIAKVVASLPGNPVSTPRKKPRLPWN